MVNATVYLSDNKANCEKVKHALAFTMFIDDEIINAHRIKIKRMECEKEQYGVEVYALNQRELDIIKGFVRGYITGWNHFRHAHEKKPEKTFERI